MPKRILAAGTDTANSDSFSVFVGGAAGPQSPVTVLVGGMESGDADVCRLQMMDDDGNWEDVYEDGSLVTWSFEVAVARAIYGPGVYRVVRTGTTTGSVFVDISTPSKP